jgi:hypothetical protein
VGFDFAFVPALQVRLEHVFASQQSVLVVPAMVA